MSQEFDDTSLVNLRHLRAWLAVVEEGSITAAARRLWISQPALSQQLKALESFVGGELLERLHRGVQPTPLGRALMDDARATLIAASRLTRKGRDFSGLEAGILEVVTLPSLVHATLLEPIRRWHREHADVAIRLHEFPLQTLLAEQVAMGVGDLAIGVNPPRWSGPVIPLGWEELMAVLPPDDPLADRSGAVELVELADRSWVLYDATNGLSSYVTAACAQAGFRPREAVSTSQVEAAVRLAIAGIGPVLVPSDNVPAGFESAARPLDPPVGWDLAAFARSDLSGPAAAFVEMLLEHERPPKPSNALEMRS